LRYFQNASSGKNWKDKALFSYHSQFFFGEREELLSVEYPQTVAGYFREAVEAEPEAHLFFVGFGVDGHRR